MLLTNVALLAAMLSSVQAFAGFSIPDGHPEGVYSVYLHSNGTEVHTKLADPSSAGARPPIHSAKFRRDTPPISIGCGNSALDPRDTDAANDDLDFQCGGFSGNDVGAGMNFYSFRGNTVAFYCNFAGPNRCDSVQRRSFDLAVTGFCGRYQAGWGTIWDWAISYGYDVADSQFCGTGI